MTNQEIDEQVARKLGHPSEVGCDCGDSICNEQWQKVPPKNYCTDIKAAWEIVDKMPWFCLSKDEGDKWSVWDMPGTEEAETICSADTAPMAICLAFLKLP